MTAPYAGHCACGNVSASISGEPVMVGTCWCRQCQQISGGGPTHNAMFSTADCKLSGNIAERSYLAASGNSLTLGFCPECFTPITVQSSARPQFMGLRLGFLDEGHGLKPRRVIWTAEAPEWAQFDPSLDQYPGQPPAPAGPAPAGKD